MYIKFYEITETTSFCGFQTINRTLSIEVLYKQVLFDGFLLMGSLNNLN